MNGAGDDDRDNDQKKKDTPERFADLIGETKKLKGGSVRVHPPPSTPKRPRCGRDEDAETSAGTHTKGGFRFPDAEEPRLGATPGVSDATLFELRRGAPPPEENIDLHGLRRAQAERVLADRIESARTRGLRCVAVIHGRGRGSPDGTAVLRDAVPEWLARRPCANHILAFAPAPKRLGGEGVLLVRLRSD